MVFQINKKIRIALLIIFILILSYITVFCKSSTETNLLQTILPQNILNEKNFIPIANKSSSAIRVVFESNDEIKLNNLKDNFEKQIQNSDFEILTPDFNKLLSVYTKYPTNFLSDNTRNLLVSNKYNEVKDNAIQELYNPIGIQFTELDKDPYLLLSDFIKSKSTKETENNFNDEKYYDYKILTIKDDKGLSPSIINKNVKNLISIEKKLSDKNNKIYLAGSPIHSYYASKNATISINIICFLATLLIIILTFIYFKNMKILIPIALSIILGFWAGFAFTKLCFKSFHILTLVFETTLIGIGIDYSYHYLFNNNIDKKFIKNLTFSMISTVVAFILLYFSNIELLKQISVFTSFGLITIYTFIIVLYPCFNFSQPQNILKFKINKKIKITYFCLLFLIIITGLFKISFNDSLTAFYTPSKKLIYAESLFNKVSGQNGNKVSIITITGSNIQEILEREEHIISKLNNINYYSLSSFTPSLKRQKENINLVKNLYRNNINTYKDFLSQEQINKLLNDKPAVISFDYKDLDFFKNFLLNDNTSLIMVYSDKIPTIQENYAQIININGECTKYMKTYRKALLKILPIVLLTIFIILSFIYKIKNAIKMILPIILGIASAISLTCIIGQDINLFSIVALFLVLGFTIDYSVFRVSNGKKAEDAIFISCATTLFSFLALSFVSFKFISSVSLILFLGILISYITGLFIFDEDIK